jgi:RNA polymerase-binding transcription factor DksA
MALSVETLEALKRRLEEERERLQREIVLLHQQTFEEGGRPFPGSELDTYGNHLADQATETFEEEKTVALEAHLRGLLAAVERALERMAEGTYGRCQECGQPIDPERLEALPWADLCFACKARQERRQP